MEKLKMTANSIMPICRYKGRHLYQVPNSYLFWLYEQMKDTEQSGNSKLLLAYLVANLASINT